LSRILGIDLGTSNACAAVFDGGTVQIIPNAEGSRTTPSVCAHQPSDGTWLVGHAARRQTADNLQNTVYSPLRLLGRRFHSEEITGVPYPNLEAKDGEPAVQIDGRTYTAVDLCAVVIMALKQAAETYLGDSVEWAVLTVPTSFNRRQRDAVRDAAAIAGLGDAGIMNSSTAAGLAYGFFMRPSEKVAVYDLGGGTFDVSILAVNDGILQTLATGGDGDLGGMDIDCMVANWLAEELETEHGVDITSKPNAVRQLLDVSEKAKCALSTKTAAPISFSVASTELGAQRDLERLLTREHLSQMTKPLLERTIDPCERVLSEAGLSAQHIDAVIPVGGQTRSPDVLETVRKIFGNHIEPRLNPDEASAIGAAIQGGILGGEVSDLLVLDVTSHALGCDVDEGTFVPVVERGSGIPTKSSVSIALDPSRKIQVVEEETNPTKSRVPFGQIDLRQLGLAPARRTRLQIVFSLDMSQNLEVTLQCGWKRDTLVTTLMAPAGRLTKREIEKSRIETNLTNAQRAEDAEIDVIREAYRWLSVSLATLESIAFMVLPLEERMRLSIPDEFVRDFAASTAEHPEALRAVALNPEWTARYDVRYCLVMNPATPLDITMRFVDELRGEDLTEVARTEWLPEALRSHARTILKMRLPGSSASQ
jgi:molecular chaperone DnaK